MPFQQPKPEPLSTAERVLFWALLTIPVLAGLVWLARLLT
jgi:hypothetical protein